LLGSFYPPAEARAGQPVATQALIIHESGERRWRRIEFRTFHDEKGGMLGLFGVIGSTDSPALTPDGESFRLRIDLLKVRERLQLRHGFDTLIGDGPEHRRLLDQVATAAATTVPVLIV